MKRIFLRLEAGSSSGQTGSAMRKVALSDESSCINKKGYKAGAAGNRCEQVRRLAVEWRSIAGTDYMNALRRSGEEGEHTRSKALDTSRITLG